MGDVRLYVRTAKRWDKMNTGTPRRFPAAKP